MLVINLNKWREEDITAKCLSKLNDYQVLYPDQDVLNIVLLGHVKLISNSWNFNTKLKDQLKKQGSNLTSKNKEIQQLINDILQDKVKVNIYHYLATPKPWWSKPISFNSGQLLCIEETYLTSYWASAITTPIYGEIFVSKLSSSSKYFNNITPLLDYSNYLREYLDKVFKRHTKKFKKLKLLVVFLIIVQILELTFLLLLI